MSFFFFCFAVTFEVLACERSDLKKKIKFRVSNSVSAVPLQGKYTIIKQPLRIDTRKILKQNTRKNPTMNMFEWEEDNFSYEDSDHFEEVRFFRFT